MNLIYADWEAILASSRGYPNEAIWSAAVETDFIH